MRRFLFILAVCFSLSITAQEVQLSWKKDFNEASELAKSENKDILVYFTKNDCEACLEFYTKFFKQDAFKTIADNFVFLMLDGSDYDIKTTDLNVIKQRRLSMHYNKSSTFPSVIALDSNGKELGQPLLTTDDAAIENYLTFLNTLK